MWCIVLYVIKKNIEEDFIMWKDQAKKLLRLIAPRKASKCFFGVTGSAEETAFHEPNFLTASDQIGLDFSILLLSALLDQKKLKILQLLIVLVADLTGTEN